MVSHIKVKLMVSISNGVNPSGVFETMRAYEGKIFKVKDHIQRLFSSAKSINLKIPYSPLQLEKLLKKDLEKSKIKEAYVRLALVPQVKHKANPVRNGTSGAKISLIIKEAPVYPDIFYRKGIKLITAPTQRDFILAQNPKIKSSNFLNAILAKIETSPSNVFEVILLNKMGLVTEGTTSNIFMVKNKMLFTPPSYLGLLEGITRQTVMALALDRKYQVRETPFTRFELYNADEVFISNSSIEIMPVAWVDGRMINRGRVGAITKELSRAYKEEVKKEAFNKW